MTFARRVLAGIELVTGAAALAGGVLLMAAPDSLLNADPAALADSPFTDWRTPGILLASLVGADISDSGRWKRYSPSSAQQSQHSPSRPAGTRW